MKAPVLVTTSSDHRWVVRDLGDGGEAVGFGNFGNASDERVFADLVRATNALGVTVWGFCEGADRDGVLAEFTVTEGWSTYHGRRAGGASVPGAWQVKTWAFLGGHAVTAVPRTWVGPKGAGPEFAKAKVITVIVLRHRVTGVVVTFVITHPIPSVTRRGLAVRERVARRKHYRRHVRALAAVVEGIDTAVVVMADLQAPRTFKLLHPLHRVGLRGWTTEGTHGRRPIDHVLTRDAR